LSKRAISGGLALAAPVALLAGCGSKPASEASTTEVRGEPIQAAAVKTAASPAEVRGDTIGRASATFTVTPSSAAAVPTPAPDQPVAGKLPDAGYPLVGFEKLAGYGFEVSDELLGPVTNDVDAAAAKTNGQIPETVRVFNQRRAAIKGFMLPLKVEGGLVTELLIMKDQSMCCYGATPKINEWVSVKMAAKGVKPMMDQPVTLLGTLHVGEMRENGYLIGIYRMDGEKMQAPEN